MNLIKRIIAITTVFTVLTFVGGPALAVTVEELQAQINALLAQLATLQTQLAELQGTTPTVTGCTITSFDRNLKQGMSGDDVKCLQIILNSATDTQVAATGVGSSGAETTYFGPLTFGAVVKFQEKYASEILATYGLTTGTGFVGTTTRAKLNTLIGVIPPPPGTVCGNGICETGETSTNCLADCPVTPPVAAGLTVALAADTPASATVADNANANFTKFTLSAGSEGDVKISKMYITRTGLTANADLENIKIVEADTGTYRGSVGSLNVNNKALITFTPALTIPKGTTKSFYIRTGIVNDTSAGKTAALGIAASGDITSDASAVSGTFPVTGNQMTVVLLGIGTATVEELTLVDSTPDVGDTDVEISEFKVSAGSTEPITVETITVLKSGTNETTGVSNLELYDVTHSASLGTVASWDGEDKATWSNLNLVIGKGENIRFKVRVDIVKGAGKTVNADLVDGTDTLMNVKGNTYGFYITPTRSPTTWDGLGTAQTINSGALNISKSASTPATGSIASGSDITLAVYDFDAKGEEVKITAIGFDFALGGGPMLYTEVTNIKLFDESGVIVAGPKDSSTGTATRGGTTGGYVDYTDTFIVPVGVHKYTVKAKIADAVSTSDTIQAYVDRPGTTITAKGMSSGDSITATPAADVAGNALTVAAGSLTVTTNTTPAARSVAKGTTDFIWATANLSAPTSGEDVRVSTVSVLDTTSSAADADDIDNMEIWADLTAEKSTRGDDYETKVSSASNPSGNAVAADVTTASTLTQVVTVPKGSFKKIALVADLNTDAVGTVGTDSHTFSFSAVTATGATTGSDISESVSGSGQAMTIQTSGTLTVSVDSSSPSAALLLDETISTLGIFRLAVDNIEDLDLDNMTVTVTGSYTDGVDAFYFYSSKRADGGSVSDPIAIVGGGSSAAAVFSDGTVTVPANGNVLITVKALMNNIDGTTVQNGDTAIISIAAAGDVDTTGKASGAEVDSTGTGYEAATHNLYEAYPQFAFSSASSTTLIPQTSALIATINITAKGNKDITFQSGDSSLLSINISSVSDDTDSGAEETVTLKDEDGTVLDTDTFDNDLTSDQVDFNMSSVGAAVGFTVPAGQTKKLYLYADTTDYEDDGDTIQAWLDDTAADATFGIDGSGTYQEGDFIFKGDIYGPSFVNPS